MARMDDASAKPLRGQVALVTGAARRVGRAIAMELARAGADIAFTWRESRNDAFATEQALLHLGGRVIGIQTDLRHAGAAAALMQTVRGSLHRLDIVVNNAGRYETARFASLSDTAWDEMLDINVSAPFRVSREAVPELQRAGGGRIIQLSSIGGVRAFPTHAHYCASKAALSHLTRAMARALAPDIQVNAVAPGLIAFRPELDDWEQTMRDRTPLGRVGTGEDVAQAVRFFATCNRFITGQVLAVDGGLSWI